LALGVEVEAIAADLERSRRMRLDAEQAKVLVAELVTHFERIGDVLGTATAAETRDLLRAIVQEIRLDPEGGEGEIAFFAIPRLVDQKRTDGTSGNTERTGPLEGICRWRGRAL
jgi:hypothetical protein